MYQSHSETSRSAYHNLEGAANKRDALHKIIKDSGYIGKTNDELSALFDKTGSYFSPRLIELERAGRIVKLSQTRKTRSQKTANVYVTPEYVNGRQACAIKPGAGKKNGANRVKDLLQEIESYIAMGSPIHPGSTLHQRIKAEISNV